MVLPSDHVAAAIALTREAALLLTLAGHEGDAARLRDVVSDLGDPSAGSIGDASALTVPVALMKMALSLMDKADVRGIAPIHLHFAIANATGEPADLAGGGA